MDDLTLVLIGAVAVGTGVLFARKQIPGFFDRTRAGLTSPTFVKSKSEERYAHLGSYPVGQVPSSRKLAEKQVAAGTFRPGDTDALTRAIEARIHAAPQTAGTRKLYPYRSNGSMVDIGWVTQNGQQGQLSYVNYPIGGSPAEGYWRPI